MPKIKKRIILGITGGIATGKTTVMTMLSKAGIPTISSDDLAHACIRRGKPAYRSILQYFGKDILASDGQIDRRKLGKIVFADSKKRKQLEKIVHPCVYQGLKQFVRGKEGFVALDIPLLYEAGYDTWMDKVVVVNSSRAQQLKRLKQRNGLSAKDALQRIAAQMPLSIKRRRADSILHNTHTLDYLRRQVMRLLK